jgi:hypothetical protein
METKFKFEFKLTTKKNAKLYTFTGTWNEFENKYTNPFIVSYKAVYE